MATVGFKDPSLGALVERDVIAGAGKGGGKLASKIAGKLGAGSRKQAEYASAGARLGSELAEKALPHVKGAAKSFGRRMLSKGVEYARKKFLGFKSGGRVGYKRMCKGGKCGKKKYMKCFKTRSGKLVKFAMGGKVRRM